MDIVNLLIRTVNSVFTLYMMLILLEWLGPYIEFDLYAGRLRWMARLTEPVVRRVRGLLPAMGPFDFAPLATVFAVWLARTIVVGMLLGVSAISAR